LLEASGSSDVAFRIKRWVKFSLGFGFLLCGGQQSLVVLYCLI